MCSATMRALTTSVAVFLWAASCSRSNTTAPVEGVGPQSSPRAAPNVEAPARPAVSLPAPRELPPTRVAAAPRVVAIGDVHGDLDVTRSVLRMVGAIDASDHWIGANLVVMQVGDQLDRGDQERGILALFEQLEVEAARAGGAFYALNGNHEVMNAQADFRYVTPGGYRDFDGTPERPEWAGMLGRVPPNLRSRVAAFAPGGAWARRLAAHNTVMVIGDTVFAHGGLLPQHVDYGLERINRAVREYLLGTQRDLPSVLEGEDSPFWHRAFATGDDPAACAVLAQLLARVGAQRLVIGHTVQQRGINAGCEGRVWRIDVGLSRYYNGLVQALELRPDAPPRIVTGAR
jgi:hypothetical protein